MLFITLALGRKEGRHAGRQIDRQTGNNNTSKGSYSNWKWISLDDGNQLYWRGRSHRRGILSSNLESISPLFIYMQFHPKSLGDLDSVFI